MCLRVGTPCDVQVHTLAVSVHGTKCRGRVAPTARVCPIPFFACRTVERPETLPPGQRRRLAAYANLDRPTPAIGSWCPAAVWFVGSLSSGTLQWTGVAVARVVLRAPVGPLAVRRLADVLYFLPMTAHTVYREHAGCMGPGTRVGGLLNSGTPPPLPPCLPGPLSCQRSIATGRVYGGAKGTPIFFYSPCPRDTPPLPVARAWRGCTPPLPTWHPSLPLLGFGLTLLRTLIGIEYSDLAGGGSNIVEETSTTTEVHTRKPMRAAQKGSK